MFCPITNKDTDLLRSLAAQYMTFATSPAQLRTQQLWAALNTGRMQRPMVMIDQIPWHEMDLDGSLVCHISHPYWRNVEQWLRRSIYQATYMPADMVLPPYILLPRMLQDPDYRVFGLPIDETVAHTDIGNNIVSHGYHNQFETLADVEKIQLTALRADRETEAALQQEAARIFAGIAPFHLQGVSLHLGLWDTIAMWMNVDTCYYTLLDEPELLHAMMERVTQAALQWIAQGNEDALFDTVGGMCHCSCTLTEPFPAVPESGISSNAWAFGMAQLFTSVSPAVTRDFELQYMRRLFPHFSHIYYGCCERLDDRLHMITEIPNISKISCSPWSDRDAFAEALPKHIILSHKPNPALVCVGAMDTDAVRADLQHTLRAAKRGGTGLEIILKDNSSVQYQPKRLWEFSRIALDIAEHW